MPVHIYVAPSLTTIAGMDRLRINDTYYEAPEPPQENEDPNNGIRSSAANLLFLHELFPDAQWHDPNNRLVEARAYRFLARLRAAPPGEYERAFPFKVLPTEWQLHIFTHARLLTNIALAPAALGTGKTKMALDIAADKYLRDEIDGVAVICLNGLKRQWIHRAIPEHLSDTVAHRTHLWKGTTRFPSDVMSQRLGERYLRIVAFNVEAFSRRGSKAARDLSQFLRNGRVLLIIDESTRIKKHDAERTKEILALRNLAACRMILTGTPITKGYEDFFTQYYFLDPDIIGVSNYWAFRGRYCNLARIQGRNVDPRAMTITGYRNQEELIRKIAPVSFMIPESVLGLPEKRYERVEVEMTPEQERVYKMLHEQLVEDLAAHRIESPVYAMVRLLRLQQVLCGRYYEMVEDEQGFEWAVPRALPNNRPEVLANILEQYDRQALVWVRFRADIDDLVPVLAALGRVGVYDGETSQTERDRQVAAFQRGELDYMILNTATGSTGVDGLQCANLSIYYSNGFSREHRWQSEGRIHRLGQRHSTAFIDMVVPNSVDTKILRAYKETQDLAQLVYNNPSFLSGGNDGEENERLSGQAEQRRMAIAESASSAGRRTAVEF